jgi:hypothetical protein
MKRKWIIVTLCVLCSLPIKSQNQQNVVENYWNYHNLIGKAEIAFYLNNDIDSCLYYYNQAFNTFDFNYVHDLVNAAQIACFSEKEYKPFIYKGLHYGLKSSHLKQIPIITEIIREIEDFEKTTEYKVIRQNYLSGLNFDYLSWIYDLGIEDQIAKNKAEYDVFTLNYINKLIEKIKEYGFPSNRVIGIECSTVFSEAKRDETDLATRITPYPRLSYFITDDAILSNHFIMVLLHHRDCSYTELKNIMLEEISKGNLHPREFGFIHDRQSQVAMEIWNKLHSNCPILIKEDGVFRIGGVLLSSDIDKIACSQGKVNALRAKYNIVPLEVDEMKRGFEKGHGFKLFWGFWDCL